MAEEIFGLADGVGEVGNVFPADTRMGTHAQLIRVQLVVLVVRVMRVQEVRRSRVMRQQVGRRQSGRQQLGRTGLPLQLGGVQGHSVHPAAVAHHAL